MSNKSRLSDGSVLETKYDSSLCERTFGDDLTGTSHYDAVITHHGEVAGRGSGSTRDEAVTNAFDDRKSRQ